MSNALRYSLSDADRKPIRYFGGKGDGVADDTAAFNAAIAWANSLSSSRGAQIDLHSGVFRLTANTTQMTRPVVWQGNGPVQSRLLCQNCNGLSFDISTFDWTFHYSALRGLSLVTNQLVAANKLALYHRGKVESGAHGVQLELRDVMFTHDRSYDLAGNANNEWGQIAHLYQTDYVLLDNVFARGSSLNNAYSTRTTSKGILVENSTGFQMVASQVWNTGSYGLRVIGQSEGTIVDGCTFLAQDTGILLEELVSPSNNTCITDTHFGNYLYGIRFAQNANPANDSIANTIKGCFVLERAVDIGTKALWVGIDLFTQDSQVTGNVIRSNSTVGTTKRVGLRMRPGNNTINGLKVTNQSDPIEAINVGSGLGYVDNLDLIDSGTTPVTGSGAGLIAVGTYRTNGLSAERHITNDFSVFDLSGNRKMEVIDERILFGGRDAGTRELQMFSFAGGAATYDGRILATGGHASNAGQAVMQYDGIDHRFSGAIRPVTNGGASCGNASARWSEVFAQNGTINTSDARLKQDMHAIADVVLDAWAAVNWCQFRYIEAVRAKGGRARLHIGLVAQQVIAAFQARGLDPFAFGLVCYDKWDAQPEVRDREGQLLRDAQPAGDQYSIRYEEALALEAALMRRELGRLRGK